MLRKTREVSVYQSDRIIAVGTVDEVANLNLS